MIKPESERRRVPGQLKGQISVPDSFFEPMSEADLALWANGPVFAQVDQADDHDSVKR